jgi:hypothetical protein
MRAAGSPKQGLIVIIINDKLRWLVGDPNNDRAMVAGRLPKSPAPHGTSTIGRASAADLLQVQQMPKFDTTYCRARATVSYAREGHTPPSEHYLDGSGFAYIDHLYS